MPNILYLIIAAAFEQICNVYDAQMTLKGVASGLAVEGNTFLVGPKPTARALYLRDALYLGCLVTPAIICLVYHATAVYFGLLAGPIVFGVKHILGGLAWKSVLAGGKAPTS
jgi:hypothetical protein